MVRNGNLKDRRKPNGNGERKALNVKKKKNQTAAIVSIGRLGFFNDILEDSSLIV